MTNWYETLSEDERTNWNYFESQFARPHIGDRALAAAITAGTLLPALVITFGSLAVAFGAAYLTRAAARGAAIGARMVKR